MHRLDQLYGIREYLLYRKSLEALAAHVKQMFCCRVEVDDASIAVQQDNGSREVLRREVR